MNPDPPGATRLVFSVAPTGTVAGVSIVPPVQVAVQDANGNTVATSTASITVAIANNPGGGTLSGMTTVNALSGVATFSNLSIDKAGTGYTLVATATGLANATSGAFNVTPGAATKLAFTTQPGSIVAGAAISPAIRVTVQDANGDPVTGATASITVAIGTNPGGATLGGTKTVAAVNGVATFADLSLDRAGTAYTLTAASSGLMGAISAAFDVTPGAATRLAFAVQPSDAVAGSAIAPPVQVVVWDAYDNTVTTSTASITVAIGTNPAGGTLSGTLTKSAAGGVATFADLSVNRAGSGYTLTAASSGLTGVTSTAFAIQPGSGNKLAFVVQPGTAVVGGAITPAIQVAVQDGSGNTVPTATDAVTLALADNPTNAVLSGTLSVNAVAGIATFSNVRVDRVGSGYTLNALGSGLIAAKSATFGITQAATTTTVTADTPDPSLVGQAVTVSYSVVVAPPGSGIPTGNVTVTDGAGTTCTGTVGAASCLLTFVTAGARTLRATYAGDANYAGGTSGSVAHQVNAAATTTVISSDLPDPSVTGQPITVNYSVTVTAPGGGTPGGTVTVSDGTVSCAGSPTAGSCQLIPTAAGAKTLTATYAGTTDYRSSADTETHQVNPAATTTAITSDLPDPSVVGAAVTVAYSVTATSPGGGTPAGNVTVSDGAGTTCNGTAAAGSCQLTFATAGAKTLTATYAGSVNYTGSASPPAAHQVTGATTTTTITADTPDPSTMGQAYTVSYSVTSAGGTPTGSVTVRDGTGASCSAAVSAGSCNLTSTTAGAKTLTAVYPGDGNFAADTSAGVAHQVNPATTVTAVKSSANPAVFGQAVTYTATVTSGGGTPTGNVRFQVDGTNLGTPVALTDGVATSVAAIGLAVGTHVVTASYLGTTNFTSSSGTLTPDQTVNTAGTTTVITTDLTPSTTAGVGYLVTVVVSAATPGGSVTVSDDAGASCVVTLASASGSCTLVSTAAGTRTVTAQYGGNADFPGGTSAGQPHPVTAAAATHLQIGGVVSSFPSDVTVTALDQFNNVAAGYAGQIHFATGDRSISIVLPPDYTFTGGDLGVHKFVAGVTLVTSGTQSVTATDTAVGSITGTQVGITVP